MESILFDIFWCSLESFYLFTNNFRVEIKLEKQMSQKTSSNPDQKQISLHLWSMGPDPLVQILEFRINNET